MVFSLQVLRQGELGSAACVYWEYGYTATLWYPLHLSLSIVSSLSGVVGRGTGVGLWPAISLTPPVGAPT